MRKKERERERERRGNDDGIDRRGECVLCVCIGDIKYVSSLQHNLRVRRLTYRAYAADTLYLAATSILLLIQKCARIKQR